MSDSDRDRIGDILVLVTQNREDMGVMRNDIGVLKKAMFGNGTVGMSESLRIVTRIVDDHITAHEGRTATARAIRTGALNRTLNIVERALPWAALAAWIGANVGKGPTQ
jgi:hypothetical protein